MRVIMFVFGGRKANLELALPYYARILAENPDTEIHLWDLARDPADSAYMRTITGIDRLTVRTEFYDGTGKAMHGQNRVWRHYALNPKHHSTVFVKIDDDVSFLQTDTFGTFARSARENRTHLISALTINNGASTRHIPALWAGFQALRPAIIPEATPLDPETADLLGVHKSADYADMCHTWFADNWRDLPTTGQLIPTDDWTSINAIAMTHDVLKQISRRITARSPQPLVAGRPQTKLGDEGSANLTPRLIHAGFTAAHLTFGPQQKAAAPGQIDRWRDIYAVIGKQYLSPRDALASPA